MTQTKTAIQWMLEAIRWSASADNTQPWRFRVAGNAIEIYFSPSAHSFALTHPASLLSLGMLQENCVQMADALALALHIEMPATYAVDKPVCRLQLPAESGASQISMSAPALFQRHTNRLPFLRRHLAPDLAARIGQSGERDCRVQLMCDKQAISPWVQLVRRGSELRFQTKEAHLWLDASLRMTSEEAERGDGLDVATFHLPPGGKALLSFIRDWRRMSWLNRFGIYKLLAAIEADLLGQAPGLLIVSAKSGGDLSAIAAGRSLARSWIELNQAGCAVQPYFVVPDQLFRLQNNVVDPALQSQVESLSLAVNALLPADDVLYMMLRVGYPRKVPVKSRRLTIEQLRCP